MADEVGVVCSIAQERHRGAALWRHMWTLLLWLMGLSIVIFLIMAVLFMLREEWVPAAVLTLGSIVEGAGIKWVTDRRADAVAEENEVFREVEAACRPTRR